MEPSNASFHHPYQPYDIQLEFMQNLYSCIENGQIGIFESPTGTGKSLSMICGALTWLRNNQNRQYQSCFPKESSGSDWLLQAEIDNRRRELLEQRRHLEEKLRSVREREKCLGANGNSRAAKRARGDSNIHEQDFVLDDYESDNNDAVNVDRGQSLSSTTQALLEQLHPDVKTNDDEQAEDRLKIIFCSRTHSQLTQIVDELRKVSLPSGISESNQVENSEVVKHLSLGSRKNLCINSKVVSLSSTTAINEQCIDLQRPGILKDKKCEYLPSQAAKVDRDRLETFRNYAIANIRDIEDLGKLGKHMKLCPYYASRSIIPHAEVITLPYPLLLQKVAREALGISVKNNIVIVDEAHNLIDAIAETLSVSLKASHIALAKEQVTEYCSRFKNRLKGKNRVYIAQVIRLLNSVLSRLQKESKQPGKQVMISIQEIMSDTGVDQIRPHKLLKYLHESKIVYKVEGYAELIHERATNTASVEPLSHSPQPRGVLAEFQSLLVALMNPASEGRFFITNDDQELVIKYTLLDPKEHFRDIVDEARAIILAGGTMSPMSDFADRLFTYLKPERIRMHAFGHVISPGNLLVEPVMKGPSGLEMDFTWTRRRSAQLINELGEMIADICAKTPDGTVVFFPSYDYLALVVSTWKQHLGQPSVWERIADAKRVYEEEKSSAVENLLRNYAESINAGRGAVMLAVVGGKLSEGINFSDKLGRVVICVGLPFPNIQSAEWKAKVDYIKGNKYEKLKEQKQSEAVCRDGSQTASREFTENTTMRAINQSIGRAIRHCNDYAAILLVDKRFVTTRIQTKLPGWIRSSCREEAQSWKGIEKSCVEFFHRHNKSRFI